MPSNPIKDPFNLHKVALRPLLHQLDEKQTSDLFETLESLELKEFFNFLRANRLDLLWQDYLVNHDHPDTFEPWLTQQHGQAWQLAVQQLMEQKHLKIIHQAFRAAAIPYFIFKGANLRYIIYQNPALRSSCDIDIFVPDTHKIEAVKCLALEGYELHATDENVSFEVSMVRNNVHIDLHWYFLRQGRTRIDMTKYLFANTEQFSNGFWGLNHSANLYVMLVHPVFSKHLVSPSSMLIHMVDLHRLLQHPLTDWDAVIKILDQSGMRTAAWCSLDFLYRCSGVDEVNVLAEKIRPGYLRGKFIEYWIEHDLISRFFSSKLPFRSLFSLALQDRFGDAVRAVSTLKKTMKQSGHQIKDVESAAACQNKAKA